MSPDHYSPRENYHQWNDFRSMPKFPRIAAICFVLTVLTVAAFWQVKDNGFITYDDVAYVTQNPQVQGGLSISGLRWAFTATAAGYWHPLTWLSHMLDWQLYGADPRGHHLTSLFFHVINTLLLFWVLVRFTRRLWPAALVAALFAWHPLHVESVAWAAERKDVLSAFFWLLTMWAYLRYVERPGTWRYLVILVCFALGLMAKPMVVTEPLVLLLLDYWPLGRWPGQAVITTGRRKTKLAPEGGVRRSAWRLVREKVPLLVLAAIFCLITIIMQSQAWAVISTDLLPFWPRLQNALVSYVSYLVMMFWPLHLAIYYPHPLSGLPYSTGLPWWQVAGAGLILAGVTALVYRGARRFPYLPVGWLWYLVTLVPVIGLLQAGGQAMADRFTYIPLIGIFLILAFGVSDWAGGIKLRQGVIAAAWCLALMACLLLTWRQVGYWRDSESLFTHTVKVTANNYLAYANLGLAYDQMGRRHEAIASFYQALRLNPKMHDVCNILGIDLAERGDVAAAIPLFQQAIRQHPEMDEAYHNLGLAYLKQGRSSEAREMFQAALKKNPGNAGAREMLKALQGR
jgi:protein O-mannosyl-transferase